MKAFTAEELQDLLKSYPVIEAEITEATEKVEAVLSIFPNVMATLKKLEAENAELKKHCEWLEGNLDLKNTVIADLKHARLAVEEEMESGRTE